jgi:hypothetical protein
MLLRSDEACSIGFLGFHIRGIERWLKKRIAKEITIITKYMYHREVCKGIDIGRKVSFGWRAITTFLFIKTNVLSPKTFARELALVCIIDHLPSKLQVDSVYVYGLLEEVALLERPLHGTNAGCFGVGTVAVSLLSMITTFDMVGRSFGSSCTHKSPTFKHFTNWYALQASCRAGSIKSKAWFSTHNFHAWDKFKIRIGMKHKRTKIVLNIKNKKN